MKNIPVTPYNGTGGYVQRPASIARAEHDVASGKLAERQQSILRELFTAALLGATWRELSKKLGEHHGAISGALSNLHKAGKVFMLNEKREGSHVYVHARHRDAFADSFRIDEPAQTTASRHKTQLVLIARLIADAKENEWSKYHHDQLEALADWITENVIES